MVLWNFDLQLKNYSTMEKKLWYSTETIELRFMKEKEHGRLPKTRKRLLTMENTMVIYPKECNFLNKYNALEL